MRLPAGLITITAVPAVTVLVSDFIAVEFVGATGLEVLVEVGDRAKPCGCAAALGGQLRAPVWPSVRFTGRVRFGISEKRVQADTVALPGGKSGRGR